MTDADVLLVVHHDDEVTRYEKVSYELDRKGVTVHAGGQQVRHEDVLYTEARKENR